jgi:hypothetical protein
VLILLVSVIFVRGKLLKPAAVFAVFGLVLLWWLTVKPNNDAPWPPDVAERPGQKSMVMKSLSTTPVRGLFESG